MIKKLTLLSSLLCCLTYYSTGQNSLYIGPYSSTDSPGRISSSGTTAELSLSNRAVNSFVGNPSNGERWVIYNSGTASDGRLRFWTGGDKLTLTRDGSIYLGNLVGDVAGGGRLSLSGASAELALNNRNVTEYIENPTMGERWVIYNSGTASDGRLRFWTGGDKLTLTRDGSIYLGNLVGDVAGGGRLSLSGATAELALNNRNVTEYIENPTMGERWVIYNSGTASDGRLRFWTGGDKIVFTKEGKIGIGTTDPSGLLHLSYSNDGIDYNQLIDGNKIQFQRSNNGASYIDKKDNGSLNFRMGPNFLTKMIILNDGNIGIGTTTPQEKLDVNGKIQSDYLKVNAVTDSEGGEIMLDGPNGYNDWRIDNRYGHFRLHHSGINYFQLNSNGSLGLGTSTTGSHKLAVEGSIGAREVTVEANGWSDFVFANDYELRTLEEVEEHITENGHLPEIPSQSEVTENGINLGEMDSKLLQKIEELTLYMIDMNKQLKSQSAKMEQLKQENSELKEKVSRLENK